MDRRSFCDDEADYSRVVDGVWRPGPSRKSNPRSGRGRGQLNYLDSPDVRMSDRKIQNRTSGSPESSDDNLSNMLNGKTHDKEKWYVKNVKCDDHFVKRDRAGNWAKSDATRKRYNFHCHGTDSGDSRRSSVSSVNAYKWVKKTQNWRMGKQQPLMNLPVDAPKNNINGDVDSKRRPIMTSPFYYTVPEDTARVNSLPPGVYLIIPMMCVKPGMSQALREPLDGGSSGNKKKQAVKKKNDKSDQKGAAKDASETQEDTNTEDGKKNGTGTDQDDKEGNAAAAAAAAVEEVAANIADVLLAVEALPGVNNLENEELGRISAIPLVDKCDTKVQVPTLETDEDFRRNIRFDDLEENHDSEGNADFVRENLRLAGEAAKQLEKKSRLMTFMCSALPDADVEFIDRKYEELNGDETAISEFLGQAMETRDYLKESGEDAVSQDRKKWWKYYIADFSVEKFLDKVQDPEKTFNGERDPLEGPPTAAEISFLEKRYATLPVTTVRDTFNSNRRNLTRTCETLDKMTREPFPPDRSLLKHEFEEGFLKEVAYIVHNLEIRRHVEEERDRKLAEAEWAKEEQTFFECIACFDDEVLPSEVLTCPEGHITCRNCLANYLKVLYSDGMFRFSCFEKDCESEYTTKTIRSALNESLFSKIMAGRAAEEIDQAKIPGLEKCPACEYAYIPDPDNKIFQCRNEECLLETCRLCLEPSHIPLPCTEVERPKDLIARKKIEETMTEKLIRRCPSCHKKYIIKIDGCNKITCSCGTLLCYLCRQVIQGYDHFDRTTTSGARCPLYTSNKQLHEVEVRNAGIAEKERILREDESIRLLSDPTQPSVSGL